jgi:flagellar motor protein MotB
MHLTRSLLLVPLVAIVALSGCRTRGGASQQNVLNDEHRAEIARLSAELEALNKENEALKSQREIARTNEASVGGQLSQILQSGQIAGVYQTDRGGIALGEDFAFAKGSADLNADGQKAVGQLAERLGKGEYADARIIVEGHTDDSPVVRPANKEKYVDNWGLSAARAATVVRALEKAGIAPTRLHGAFRGEHDPSTKGSDKAANRRVELYVK